jgi:prepilin-type N-terminal cleavage/methylation domain-containing protein
LIHRLLKEERGYSLVEVMASIVILSIAIIPMVGMFDMGINTATRASDYDKARALANLKLEQAKGLPFLEVQENFPEGIGTPYDDDTPFTEPGGEFANFTYKIEKHYMEEPPTDLGDDLVDPSGEADFVPSEPSDTATGLIRITVIVQWDDNEYKTLGLVAE